MVILMAGWLQTCLNETHGHMLCQTEYFPGTVKWKCKPWKTGMHQTKPLGLPNRWYLHNPCETIISQYALIKQHHSNIERDVRITFSELPCTRGHAWCYNEMERVRELSNRSLRVVAVICVKMGGYRRAQVLCMYVWLIFFLFDAD